MGTFASITFRERGGGNGQSFPLWSKPGTAIVKKLPGGDDNVIQVIGVDLPRLALVVRVTGAQLTSLYGQVGNSGSLVFSYETTTAYLESIENVEQIFNGDNYVATLNLIRSSGAISGTPATAFITEGGDTFITEGGDTFVTE